MHWKQLECRCCWRCSWSQVGSNPLLLLPPSRLTHHQALQTFKQQHFIKFENIQTWIFRTNTQNNIKTYTRHCNYHSSGQMRSHVVTWRWKKWNGPNFLIHIYKRMTWHVWSMYSESWAHMVLPWPIWGQENFDKNFFSAIFLVVWYDRERLKFRCKTFVSSVLSFVSPPNWIELETGLK